MSDANLLLDLSLEVASAKEALAAVEAIQRFLTSRYKPGKLIHHDFDPNNTEHAARFAGSRTMETKGRDLFLLVPFAIPMVFELLDCEAEPPQEHELSCLRKMVRAFNDRMQEVATLKGLTFTDDLTGLYNQRYMEVILDREFSLAKRNDVQFSVLFLDMDHFKAVNDTHGHLIGSRLLYEVGQEIKRTLRESDITFRYGGDEFVIILAHTGLEDAVVVAERIRLQVEKKRFLAREALDIRLTASIGVASVPDHATSKQQILKAADEALYGVKKAVRNRVIAATNKIKD
ncbi:MAG TPA: GGDEF domain-containing protein [Bdellovibrionota bacterium]|jgi:diguanylate cyclase (GGDEF)-like protein